MSRESSHPDSEGTSGPGGAGGPAPSRHHVASPAQLELCQYALGALPHKTAILDEERRITFASRSLIEFLKCEDPSSVIGKRFGEAFRCAHSIEDACGCGASSACPLCGALRAILEAQAGFVATEECRIRSLAPLGEVAYDLEVSGESFLIGGELHTIVAIHDLSDRKRRLALERIFIHDLFNLLGGVRGALELLRSGSLPDAERGRLLELVSGAVDRALDDVEGQRTLLKAEDGELRPTWSRVDAGEAIEEVVRRFSRHDAASGKEIVLEAATGLRFSTDRALLGRVLGNMLLTALEATERGRAVTLRVASSNGEVVFSVHNPGHIPPDIQRQVFERSFSTKAADRGLGTYGMKLLGERYLGGTVAFRSDLLDGTTFSLTVPCSPAAPGHRPSGESGLK